MKNAHEERTRQCFGEEICSYLEMEYGGTVMIDDLIEILEDWHNFYQQRATQAQIALQRLGINRYD